MQIKFNVFIAGLPKLVGKIYTYIIILYTKENININICCITSSVVSAISEYGS